MGPPSSLINLGAAVPASHDREPQQRRGACAPWKKKFPSARATLVHPAEEVSMSRCGHIYDNKATGERAVVLRGDDDSHWAVGPGASDRRHTRRSSASTFTPSSRSDSWSSPAGSGRGSMAWRAPWGPARRRLLRPGSLMTGGTLARMTPRCSSNFSPTGSAFRADDRQLVRTGQCRQDQRQWDAWPLQLALIGQESQDIIRFTKPPRMVQRVMFGLLGPIGRMRGYRGIYPGLPPPRPHHARPGRAGDRGHGATGLSSCGRRDLTAQTRWQRQDHHATSGQSHESFRFPG